MAKKVALIIGHRSKRQGAYSEVLGETEYEYMKKVASYLEDIADVYERPNTLFVSEASRIYEVVNAVNKKQYDLVLSLHFNSFSDPKAHGATALYFITNKRTKAIASEFVELMQENFCIKKRALIPVTSTKQNGGIVVSKTLADAVLLEPFFGSNPQDAVEFYKNHEQYANTLRALILKYCRI